MLCLLSLCGCYYAWPWLHHVCIMYLGLTSPVPLSVCDVESFCISAIPHPVPAVLPTVGPRVWGPLPKWRKLSCAMLHGDCDIPCSPRHCQHLWESAVAGHRHGGPLPRLVDPCCHASGGGRIPMQQGGRSATTLHWDPPHSHLHLRRSHHCTCHAQSVESIHCNASWTLQVNVLTKHLLSKPNRDTGTEPTLRREVRIVTRGSAQS